MATASCIAVVIVCRNALADLKLTVESVGSLRDRRVGLVVIDGSSTDGTVDWLPSIESKVLHVKSEPDGGIYDAMNKGWDAAPPDSHILYLGAGDLLLELPSENLLVDSGGRPIEVALGICTIGNVPFQSRWGGEMRLRNTAHHQGMLVHKSLWPARPFDPGLRIYGDWDFNLRLQKQGVEAVHVPGFRTFASPGGVSWRHDLAEIRKVATRHGGMVIGAAAHALNQVSRWRRDRSTRHAPDQQH